MSTIYLKKQLQGLKKQKHEEDVRAFVEFMVQEVLKRAQFGATTFVCTDIAYSRYLEQYHLTQKNGTFVSFQELEQGFRDRFPDCKIEMNKFMFKNPHGEEETRTELVVNWS